MIAALGAGIVSQLYQGLTAQKTSSTGGTGGASPWDGIQAAQGRAAAPASGPPSGPPPGPENAASSNGGHSHGPVSAASAKVVADMKAMLLGLQSDNGTAGTAAVSA